MSEQGRIEPATRPYSPPEKDRWAKGVLCDELAEWDRACGRLPDARAIEDAVNRDLAEAIAREREAKPLAAPAQATEDKRRGRQIVEAEASKRGYQVLDQAPRRKARRQRVLRKTPRVIALELRIRALLTFDVRTREFAHPGPAREIIQHQVGATQGRGEYAMLTRHKRNRLLTRRLEDIADRTNLLFGADWRGLT